MTVCEPEYLPRGGHGADAPCGRATAGTGRPAATADKDNLAAGNALDQPCFSGGGGSFGAGSVMVRTRSRIVFIFDSSFSFARSSSSRRCCTSSKLYLM